MQDLRLDDIALAPMQLTMVRLAGQDCATGVSAVEGAIVEDQVGQIAATEEAAAATAVEGEIGKDRVGQIAATDKAAAATEVEDAQGKEEVSKQLRLQRV